MKSGREEREIQLIVKAYDGEGMPEYPARPTEPNSSGLLRTTCFIASGSQGISAFLEDAPAARPSSMPALPALSMSVKMLASQSFHSSFQWITGFSPSHSMGSQT